MTTAAATGEDYTSEPGYWTDDYWESLREPEQWIGIPGASDYEVSTHGRYRNLDRVVNGRHYPSAILGFNPNSRGYLRARWKDDDGERHTEPIAPLVLTVFDRPRPKGMEVSHKRDIKTHNWLSALEWATPAGNRSRRYENSPPKPKAPRPVRICILCGGEVKTNGRRCTICVAELGVLAAKMLREDKTPDRAKAAAKVAEALDYRNKDGALITDGIVKLAIVHGGYGQSRLRRLLHSVTTTLRHQGRGRRGDRQ
jgi:hypothetical protein